MGIYTTVQLASHTCKPYMISCSAIGNCFTISDIFIACASASMVIGHCRDLVERRRKWAVLVIFHCSLIALSIIILDRWKSREAWSMVKSGFCIWICMNPSQYYSIKYAILINVDIDLKKMYNKGPRRNKTQFDVVVLRPCWFYQSTPCRQRA